MQTSRPESCTTAQYMAKMIQRGNARRTEEKIKTRDDLTLFFATDDAMQTVVSREEKEALPLDDYLASNLDMQSPEPMQLIPTVKVVPQGYK
jgi:hypothetical protein